MTFKGVDPEYSRSSHFHEYEPKKTLSCAACGQPFEVKKNYQMFCSEACESQKTQIMNEISEKRLTGTCLGCGLNFRQVDAVKRKYYCYSCTKYKQKINREKHPPKKKPPSNKKRKKVSYDELNRRSEYKRVFDDKGWDHYLKGRRWDRI